MNEFNADIFVAVPDIVTVISPLVLSTIVAPGNVIVSTLLIGIPKPSPTVNEDGTVTVTSPLPALKTVALLNVILSTAVTFVSPSETVNEVDEPDNTLSAFNLLVTLVSV